MSAKTASLLNSIHLYGRYVQVGIQSQLQYRTSFILMLFGNFFGSAIEFLGIWALFSRFGSLRGWKLEEIALFYGVVNIAFALAEAFGRGFDTFSNMVKSGDFDRLLVRPRSTELQVTGSDMQLMRMGRLTQGIFVLTWAIRELHLPLNLSDAVIILSTILGGFGIFMGLMVLQATLAFWTIESLEVMNTVTYGGNEASQYPMTIYRPWFRKFFTFVVPLACVNYLPLSPLLGRVNYFGPAAAAISPLVGIAFFAISLYAWKFGVRHYHSTGS